MPDIPASTRQPRSSKSRMLAVVAGAAVATFAVVAPAFAHVEVNSPDATPGGFGTLVFSVPNESPSARVVRVQVNLPTDEPFASVSVMAKPGWAIKTRTSKLAKPITGGGFRLTRAITQITWTASTAPGIGVGEYDEFELAVGPFPEGVDSLAFPAVQSYSDNEVVRWNQRQAAGQKEPEHPVPVLDLSGRNVHPAGAARASPSVSSDTSAAPPPMAVRADNPETSDPVARLLAGTALAVGLVAMVVTLVRRRT